MTNAQPVTKEQVLEHINNNTATIIDVRSAMAYEQDHIKGAIGIPLEDLEAKISDIDKSKPIIVYCGSVECPLSGKAADLLTSKGVENVFKYEGGIKEWRESGLPVESA